MEGRICHQNPLITVDPPGGGTVWSRWHSQSQKDSMGDNDKRQGKPRTNTDNPNGALGEGGLIPAFSEGNSRRRRNLRLVVELDDDLYLTALLPDENPLSTALRTTS